MIPENRLSTTPVPAAFAQPVNDGRVPLVDYEEGGHELNNSQSGLRGHTWRAFVEGDAVMIEREGVAAVEVLRHPGIEQLALAFDHNMQPHLAFVQAGQTWLWWFDSQTDSMTLTHIPDARWPRLAMDERRLWHLADADIVLAYLRGDALCVRYQRDRFGVEHVLKAGLPDGVKLISIGMNVAGRFQFKLK